MNLQVVGICEGAGTTRMPFPAVTHPSDHVVLSYSSSSHKWKPRNPSPAYYVKQQGSSTHNESNYEGGNPADSKKKPCPPNLLITQGNTVGIIGGISVFSTLIFLEKLVWLSTKQKQTCAVPFILCSDPSLNQLQVHSSSQPHPSWRKGSSRSDDEHHLMVEKLRQKTEFLAESGAQCIVMPCHLSHAWYKDISKNCSLPFLHVGECVAQELKEANLKPVETGSRDVRIGVIATEATLMVAGYYQEKIQNQGFEVVLPDEAIMEHMVNPAVKALDRKDVEGARNLLRVAVQILLVIKAVNVVVLASDELQGLLPRDDPLVRRCIDPMDVLARSTVKWVQSLSRGSI